jgi:hypothetical protein
MPAKTFLSQECLNVRSLLNDTLRNEYGFDGSRDFFDECTIRLNYIAGVIEGLNEFEEQDLANFGYELNELCKLICRIERSSLGEYSWPFVEELKQIAEKICTEKTLSADQTPPKFYVLADGGLDAYRIYPEAKKPSSGKRLLLTIVFPKTLKHFVLLHSILGHEVGHAVYRCSKRQAEINVKVLQQLMNGGVFASPDATVDHLYSTTAPAQIQDQLAKLNNAGFTKAEFFTRVANWPAWLEEILCDLFGLITFGPAFVAAQTELLYALDPSGLVLGPRHPPVSWRVNLIVRMADILKMNSPPSVGHPIHAATKKLWDLIGGSVKTGAWFNVFTDGQLTNAFQALRAIVQPFAPCEFPAPNNDVLGKLLQKLESRVPPIGFELNEKGEPECQSVDFRHIILAGWLAAISGKLEFAAINHLCEHAIMQQRAIELFKAFQNKPKAA